MKIRNGFVSNSSSTSFLLNGSAYTIEQITEVLKLGLEIEKLLFPERDERSIGEMCEIRMDPDCNNFLDMMRTYMAVDDDEDGDTAAQVNRAFVNNREYVIDRLENKPCIVINSTGDNTIPYRIQEILESISVMKQHWG